MVIILLLLNDDMIIIMMMMMMMINDTWHSSDLSADVHTEWLARPSLSRTAYQPTRTAYMRL